MKKTLLKYINKHVFALPYISAVLLALPFINFQFGFISFVSFVPFLVFTSYFIEKHSKITKREFIFHTWLMGLLFMLLTLCWYITADTQGWSHLGSTPLKLIVFSIWSIMALIFSVGFICFAWLITIYKDRVSNNVLYILILPAAIVATQYFTSILFSVVSYGSGGRIGSFWHFGNLGLAATSTPLVFSSRIFGLYGISFLLVLANIGIYFAIKRQYKIACLLLSIPIVTSCLGYQLYNTKPIKSVRVATVQLPPEKANYYTELNKTIKNSQLFVDKPTKLMVLPEYSYFFENAPIQQQVLLKKRAFNDKPGILAYSRAQYAEDKAPGNEIVVTENNGNAISKQNKSFLIPTGEYLPYVLQATFWATGKSKIIHSFNTNFEVSRSKISEKPTLYQDVSYGVLACSGVIAPHLYQQLTNQGAEILVNTASLNEFRNSMTYHQQARQFASFNAVANNRPFVQAARGGFAYIIDKNGTYLYSSSGTNTQIGAADVTLNKSKTLYSTVGESIAYASLLILILPLLIPGLTTAYKKAYAYRRYIKP